MASKYILAVKGSHIFNPAAVAVALTALGPSQTASWWIGNAALLPFVILGGLLLARKIRRLKMVMSFFAAVVIATVAYTLAGHGNVGSSLHQAALSSPMFFLGFVMLTEPLTSPSTNKYRIWYAVIVGLLLPPQVHLFNLYSSPELALLAGNIFAFFTSSHHTVVPVLKQKIQLTRDTLDFVFNVNERLAYQPGQYMEWTLPHNDADERGNRRYFTLASSPTEPELRLGVKFYPGSSSFKKALMSIDQRSRINAMQVSGDFTMPADPSVKLAFIAGGIGITPFRSMIKYLLDSNETRSVTLLYSVRNPEDKIYTDIFETARRKLGIQTYYSVTDSRGPTEDPYTQSGRITEQTIVQRIPDYRERLFYISGTQAMVADMRKILIGMGVSRSSIKTDYFPGYYQAGARS